jgi:hypothetical protein
VLLDDDEVGAGVVLELDVGAGVLELLLDVAIHGPPSGPVNPALQWQSSCPSLPASELVSAGQSLQV